MQIFINFDTHVFNVINQKWVSVFLDNVMTFVTNWHNTWWILLAMALVWIVISANRMNTAKIILGCILAVGLSDVVNHRVIKPLIKRDRPEFTLGRQNIRLLVPQATGHSMPSNHAANAFAAASYISFLQPAAAVIVYPLAWLVAYSRVYVGVHYPSDIIVGALLGVIYAVIARRIIVAISVMIGLRKTRD